MNVKTHVWEHDGIWYMYRDSEIDMEEELRKLPSFPNISPLKTFTSTYGCIENDFFFRPEDSEETGKAL